jgi:hypothetical protein
MARARAASINFFQANIKRSAILAPNNAAAYNFLYDVDVDDLADWGPLLTNDPLVH